MALNISTVATDAALSTCRGLMHFAVPSVMNAVPLSCEASVAPLDSSPIRSPQAAHTSLLDHFRGKNIAEIGTRRGDGMACYSQVARSALAIELRPDYCTMLEQRSRNATKHGSRGFEVLCLSLIHI